MFGGGRYGGGYRESGTGCMFCTGVSESLESHCRSRCPTFKQLKSQLSRQPYIDTKLKENDAVGFAAAGFLLWRRRGKGTCPALELDWEAYKCSGDINTLISVTRSTKHAVVVGDGGASEPSCKVQSLRAGDQDLEIYHEASSESEYGEIEFLMARERRAHNYTNSFEDKLNFLGGKRVKNSEEALDVALSKMDTETGGQLQEAVKQNMKKPPLVHYSAISKYVLYLFELDSNCDVDVRCAGLAREGVKRLEWVSRKDLFDRDFVRKEIHNYCASWLQDMRACNVIEKLEELFDTAKVAAATEEAATETKPSTEADSQFDFDIVAALCASSNNVTGDHASLTAHTASWEDLTGIIQHLHKKDIRKLKLRFHPDRLKHQLNREPTDLEKKLATKAMQIMFMIFNAERETCMCTLDELKALNKEYKGDEDHGIAEDILAEKLQRVKLSPKSP